MPLLLAFSINPIRWLAQLVFAGVGWLMDDGLSWILNNTEPDLTQQFFQGQYGIMLQIGSYVMLPLLFVATIKAIFKGGLREVIRTYLVGIPVACIGAIIAIGVITMIQRIDDNLVTSVHAVANDNFKSFSDRVTNGNLDALSIGTVLMSLVLGIVMIIAFFFLMIELAVREVVLYMTTLVLPLAFAMFVWSQLRVWLAQLAEIILVTVLSKFLVIAMLGFGFAAILGSVTPDASAPEGWDFIGALTSGLLIMTMSCFAMPTLLGFVVGPGAVALTRKQLTDATPLSNVSTGRGTARRSALSAGKKIIGK